MSDIAWLLNGEALPPWGVLNGSMWRPQVTARGTPITIPGRHGALTPARPCEFEAQQVKLEFTIRGTQVEIEERVNHLAQTLADPDLILTRISGDVTASAPARLVDLSSTEFVVGTVAHMLALVAIPGAFLRGPVVESVSLSSGTVEVASLMGSTAPITDAVLRFSNPSSGLSVRCAKTGTGVSWSGAASGNLFIDVGRFRAWTGSAGDWSGANAPMAGVLDYPPQGILQMWPTLFNSARRVRLDVSGGGSLVVRAAKAYL